jgi:protein-S-isoprenylcysteine O-methyltransferase Ste14
MAWVAIAALVIWTAAVVVIRTVLLGRWPSTQFVVVDWRRWAAQEWVAVGLGAAGMVGLVGAIALAVSGSQLGPHPSPSWPWLAGGLAFITSGIAVMVWSQLTMGPSWRLGVDRDNTIRLVTAGPFRWVRNPIYTAMVGVFLGVTLLVPAVGTVIGTAMIFAFVEWQVRTVEEPLLIHRHGRDYLSWAAATGRFLPRIGSVSSRDQVESLALSGGHRE